MYLDRLFVVLGEEGLAGAQKLFGLGKYKQCLEHLKPYLGMHANPAAMELATMYSTRCHIEMGKMFEGKNDSASAEEEYMKALKLNPTYADLYNRLGLLRGERGENEKALADFRKAVDINPDYMEAHMSLYVLLSKMGMVGEAGKNLQEVSGRLHRPEIISEAEARLKAAKRKRNPVTKKSARREAGEKTRGVDKEALKLISQGDCMAAVKLLKHELGGTPTHADLENLLGVAYGNEGMLDDAIEAFERALRRNPSFIAARINLSVVLMRRGLWNEVKRELEHLVLLDPLNGIARNLLSVRPA
ncbi:MAG: tetratricopeptide repeat protein [Candidatus Eisenbacteria bacterium]|nr:tetratricopeptide repeat protein [Candidatus Eisenbacteria bacterium]